MKILVVSKIIPRPDFSSGDNRFLGILNLLASKHEVTFCIPNYQPWLKPEICKIYIAHIESLKIKFLPLNVGWFEKVIKTEKFDIGFFEFFWVAEQYMVTFIKHQKNAVVVVDSVDLHFAREETQYKLGQISRNKIWRTKIRELAVYNLADITIAVSDHDRDRILNKKKTGNVLLISNVVPTVSRSKIDRGPSLLFVGCFAWTPNVDGMLWFVNDIWPLIIREKNDAQLFIVGSNPTKEIKNLCSFQGVHVIGHVYETLPYLNLASISVAPLRYGGGMKGKVNEALAHGLPVVTTSIGAQGFNAQNGCEMFISDQPEDFANAVLKLLNDPVLQYKVGLAGQKLNEELCSPVVIEKSLDKLVGVCRDLQDKHISYKRGIDIWKVKALNFLQGNIWRLFD